MQGFSYLKITPKELQKLPKTVPFFYHPDFVLRYKKNIITYCVQYQSKTVGFIHFEIQEQKAISLPKATFNGFYLNKELIKFTLQEFLEYILADLKSEGILNIQINCAPNYYLNEANWLLENTNFELLYSDINQVIDVNSKAFEQKLNRNRQRALQNSKMKEYEFKKLNNSWIASIHKLLKDNRESNGYSMSMSLDQLKEAYVQFPDRYISFGLFEGDNLIAASVCVSINASVLYDFYHGELVKYRELSPVTMLLEGIYDFAKNENYKYLDLGISTDRGVLNKGLHQFKRSCGAWECAKNTYTLQL